MVNKVCQKQSEGKAYFIDTHAHLDMIKGKTPQEAVGDATRESVKYILNVGSSIKGSEKSLYFSTVFDNVFASVGIHPHYVKDFKDVQRKRLESMVANFIADGTSSFESEAKTKTPGERPPKLVAIGETGFDFYRNLSPKKDQEEAFVFQIELAIKNKLPLIIHDREAHDDTLRVIGKYANYKDFRAVMHCFSGDVDFATKCLELGLFISFTGVLTFPNAKKTVEVAKEVPIEKIFIETDAPFLAPQPKRGKENFPEYVRYVAYKLAEIKGMDVEDVALITSRNAEEFFGIAS
ncbi:MAG: TatD family hydrolase [Actinobacteria bacterium]|nr:TatD family hydrolase [Actinomycetota bacterium]